MSVRCSGNVLVPTDSITNLEINSNAGLERTKFQQYDQEPLGIPLCQFRRAGTDYATALSTATGTHLGLYGGTFGTTGVSIRSSDANGTTVTQKARLEVHLPPEYVAGEAVYLDFYAGMQAAAVGSATIDCQAYLIDDDGTPDGSDLVTTAAISINSTTIAQRKFTLDGSTLSPGDTLDVEITVAITDSGGANKIAWITKAHLLTANQG